MTESTRTETMQDEIDRLDLAYTKLTGRQFQASGLITGREYLWIQFYNAGYRESDLEEVILWIKQRIRVGKCTEAALKFRSLISDLGKFEDELATCRAERRNAKPAPRPKERVLGQFRPKAVETAPESVTAKPIATVDWIAELRRAVG